MADRVLVARGAGLDGALAAIDRRNATTSLATVLRLHLTYLWRTGGRCRRARRACSPNWSSGASWSIETRGCPLIDKLMVKQAVADTLGRDWVTPTLWSGDVLPRRPPRPISFVVKSRHGCRQFRIVRGAGEDWNAVRRSAEAWMRRSYGRWLDEWAYRHVPRPVGRAVAGRRRGAADRLQAVRL